MFKGKKEKKSGVEWNVLDYSDEKNVVEILKIMCVWSRRKKVDSRREERWKEKRRKTKGGEGEKIKWVRKCKSKRG